MRRILTSLPYERRIGLPGAAGGIPVTDSIRRTLLWPVADAHLDPDVESASDRLVKCDDSGSLLADAKSMGFSEVWTFNYLIRTNDNVTAIQMFGGYEHLEFYRDYYGFIGNVYICDAAGNYLQEILHEKMTPAKGVRWKCYLIALGAQGTELDIVGYHFR